MNFYSIKISLPKIIIEFRCSYKILPLSLKKIANNFNLPQKLPYPYDFIDKDTLDFIGVIPNFSINPLPNNSSILSSNPSVTNIIDIKSYTIKYCERDVEITKKFITHIYDIMIKEQNLNIFNSYSIPGFSLKCFSKNFNIKKLDLKLNLNLDQYLRQAYFGGRCEVFGNTNSTLYHYDFPGMYPLCMKEKFCFGKSKFVDGSSFDSSFDSSLKTIHGSSFDSSFDSSLKTIHGSSFDPSSYSSFDPSSYSSFDPSSYSSFDPSSYSSFDPSSYSSFDSSSGSSLISYTSSKLKPGFYSIK
jgi:hypothetical protein